jgi:uncharacterized protein YdhG (YjbR/CyaY superfamily)
MTAMKKKSTAKRASAIKGPPRADTVDGYFALIPEPARTRLGELRTIIRAAAPKGAVECIHYLMPSIEYKGAVVCYAAFKNHLSLFPMNAQLTTDLGKEAGEYRTSKGTLQFPLDKPLPKALITKIVKMRAAQNKEG